jgi:lipoprotein-anchoring transpeptidase ErfK/SrfK
VIARIGRRTQFGSPVVLGVGARRAPWVGLGDARGRWVGVISTALPNGRLGWVKQGTVHVSPARYSIVVDLSAQTLVLRKRHHVLREVPVGVGRAGSGTPTGTFVVTDELAGNATYGCCILALSGHQPHPPPGWSGGTRLAIHGGSLGASSAGCVHAGEADLRYLMATVPLGTPVTIRE